MMYQEQYVLIKESFVSNNYATSVKESGTILETLFKEIYQITLFKCNHTEREQMIEIEKEIGKGTKTVYNFGLGELVGLFRKGKILNKYENIENRDLSLAKSYNLDSFVNLRNNCVHNGYIPSKFEAQFAIQCLMVFLVSFDKIKPDESDYLFNSFEERKKINNLEKQLKEIVDTESTQITMYSIEDHMEIWEDFIDHYYAWNPSWQTESIFQEDEWFNIHKNRFESNKIKTVEYIISESSTNGGFFSEGSKYFGIKAFIDYMQLLNEKIPQVEDKLRIFSSKDLNSRITYFFGKTTSGVRSIILFNDQPFLEGEYPNFALVSSDLYIFKILRRHYDSYRSTLKKYHLQEFLEVFKTKGDLER